MTIPTTIPTGGHPADREMTELQKAVIALLGAFSSNVLLTANGGTGLAAKKSGQAHLTSATSCVNNTSSIINYDTVDEDTDSAITTGAAWKFTCPKAGQYHLSATAGLNNPAAGGLALIAAYVGGAESKRGSRQSFAAGETITLSVVCDLQLALNDQVSVRFFQNSGGNVNTETTAAVNHFSIYLIPGT
jgi:hypothetical protein